VAWDLCFFAAVYGTAYHILISPIQAASQFSQDPGDRDGNQMELEAVEERGLPLEEDKPVITKLEEFSSKKKTVFLCAGPQELFLGLRHESAPPEYKGW